jgi:uncharacterized membrane protein
MVKICGKPFRGCRRRERGPGRPRATLDGAGRHNLCFSTGFDGRVAAGFGASMRLGQKHKAGMANVARPARVSWRQSLAQRLRAYFFAGLIVTAPIGITLLIVWEVVRYFDTTLAVVLPERYNPETYMPFSLPGIGFLVMLGFVMIAGWFTAGLVGRTIMRASESLLDRTPVVRAIYGTLKQVFETIFQQSSRSFREVVLIEFPHRGAFALGFVTGNSDPVVQVARSEALVNVLVPMSPFPSSGFLLFVPESRLVHLDMSVEEGMKMVISGGIVGPSAGREPVQRPAPAPLTPEPELARG